MPPLLLSWRVEAIRLLKMGIPTTKALSIVDRIWRYVAVAV